MPRKEMATKGPKIVRLELTPLQVPFKQIVREAMQHAGGLGMAIPAEEDWPGGEFAICKMTDEEGHTGLGEQSQPDHHRYTGSALSIRAGAQPLRLQRHPHTHEQ